MFSNCSNGPQHGFGTYKRLEEEYLGSHELIKGKKTRKQTFFCAKYVVFFRPSSHLIYQNVINSLFKSSTMICLAQVITGSNIDINSQVNKGLINTFCEGSVPFSCPVCQQFDSM